MAHLILLLPIVGLGVFWLLPLSLAIPAYLVILVASGAVYIAAVRVMHRAVQTGAEGMAHKIAEVVDFDGTRGRVAVEGEIWAAVASEPLRKGEQVEILGVADRLTLRVRRLGPQTQE